MRARTIITALFIALLTLTALSGCGQKGPLYLPDSEETRD